MDLRDLVQGLSSTPFLFVGSGLSRRYYGLPDWQQLLKVFAQRVSSDSFAFESYLNKARSGLRAGQQELAVVAKLIETDFNQRWYDEPKFRHLDAKHLEHIKDNHSPFKVEMAQYLKKISIPDKEMHNEMELLEKLSKKSLSGIITTNYDNLLQTVTDGYTTYVGQEELLFSSLQGFAEIYMIHGSVDDPSSLVITQDDYDVFERKSAYLASKLMTIFLEFPIIFIGYSLNDPNVRTILRAIVRGLTDKNLEKLQNRLIYVEWVSGLNNIEVSPSSMVIEDSTIRMTTIKTDSFTLLFQALLEKKTALPVKLLRLFRQEFYNYILTNQPVGRMRVAGIEDPRVHDDDLVLAIVTPDRLGLRGLSGLTSEEWYRNIVMADLLFTADELLQNAYPQLIRQNTLLPLNKMLYSSSQSYPEVAKRAISSFDSALTNTIRKNKGKRTIVSRSISGILSESPTLKRALVDMSYLDEAEFDLEQLEQFLSSKFSEEGFYGSMDTNMRSDFNRLVRIYDWMKYGKR